MTQLAGKTTQAETKKMANIVKHLKSQGAESILVACTDLPLVFEQEDTPTQLINCTEIYANETARLSSA
jgi:aspartate/glutamate racemase